MGARRTAASRSLTGVLSLLAVLAGVVSAVLLAGPASGAPRPDDAPRVLVTTLATPITPVVADHVSDGLRRAREAGYDAYVIELDTPGGLVTAMREIVGDILASEVPVVVYVSPAGARAGSAGAVISLASHVLVMAPGTTVGAATPVGLEGEEVSDKIVSDAAAQAVALANLRGRDAGFAEDIVRDGRSATVEEAVELGVADGRATDLAGALRQADGLLVTVAGEREVTVRTAGAVVERQDLGAFRRVLQVLADPNLTFLLLTLGTLGLIYELATPGVGVAGSVGAVALVLALFSLSVLPVSAVGVLLLVVAVALFVAEALAPGVAGFAFGGAVVLVLSALFLFDSSEGVSVDPAAAVPLAVVLAVAAVLAGRVVLRTRHLPSTATGADLLTGRTVLVDETDGTTGRTFTEGAWWSVRSTGPALVRGGAVRVVGLDGLTLLVGPAAAAGEPAATAGPTGRGDDAGASAVVDPTVTPGPAVVVDEPVVPGPALVDNPGRGTTSGKDSS
ncbi:NfeD family protein [Georgenia daeguensis]|uniref:Nodulation protein NfeD n=1 Tax=Georgenia daeguensis TaxID=908355 RepID=A0ABP6UKP6_9MICO